MRSGALGGISGEVIASGIFNLTTGAIIVAYGMDAMTAVTALQQWSVNIRADIRPAVTDVAVEAFVESAPGATARAFVYDVAAGLHRISCVDFTGALANADATSTLRVFVRRVRVPGAQ